MAATRKYSFPNDISRAHFDSGFVWGTATSAYQIEGAAFEGGRQPSVWDAFCLKKPDAIKNGENGNKGINHYYKFKEDVQLMKKTGLNAYRFSLSWSRILPGGKLSMGVNDEGVAFYNNLINELIANGIEPYVTLWHWDTPNALEEDYGGFLCDKIVNDFADFAEFCYWEFGDRVKHWITLNEPQSYAASGYAYGLHAPGRGGFQSIESISAGYNIGLCSPTDEALALAGKSSGNSGTEPYIVAHNLLLAHAAAADIYKKGFQDSQGGIIGITLNSQFNEPLNPKLPQDREAAERAMDFIFGWYMEPLHSGNYPDSMVRNVGDRLPKFTDEQKVLLQNSYDFVGLNYYTARYATDIKEPIDLVSYMTDSQVHQQVEDLDGNPIGPQGGVEWFYVYAPGLKGCLLQIKNKYGNPTVFITENGYADEANNHTKIEEARVDTERVEYYSTHIQSVRDAISEGCDVKGYFAWSMMDNFEWDSGYTVRFGLFYIDYAHGNYTRYPKHSAIWFRKFLAAESTESTKLV